MTLSSSNIHDGEFTNPLDSRYVPQYELIADLPDPTDAMEGQLAVVQEDHGLYQVTSGAWGLVGILAQPGGGGSGDMLKSVYDSDDDGQVNAAETANLALSVSGADGAGAHKFYGTDAAGTPGFYTLGRLVVSPSSSPTVNDDANDGYQAPWFWYRQDTGVMWALADATVGAAVWKDLTTAASVTGLTNPLVATLDADGELIKEAAFAGFTDRYYDLETDTNNYISTGTATLSHIFNAYLHADLDSALSIVLPDPSGLGADDAPFGIISVKLASGGSVTVAQTEPWVWEKSDPSDSDPVIPTGENSVFRLRYSYDIVNQSYALSLSHLAAAAAPEAGEVTYVENSVTVSALSLANKDTHTHTHTLTSTTQDGTKYLIVGFFADGSGTVTPPGILTAINSPPTTQTANLWYYYKFDGDDITATEVELSFGKTNEMGQIVAFEVAGAHTSSPIGALGFDRSSSATRTAIGPTDLTQSVAGSLLVCSIGMDMQSGTKPTIAVNVDNGFTEIASYVSSSDGMPTLRVGVLESETTGTKPTPSYTRSAEGNAPVQLEAFVIVPADPS